MAATASAPVSQRVQCPARHAVIIIATGWSSTIPNYNPLDVVGTQRNDRLVCACTALISTLENIRRMMVGDEVVPMNPWYRGFKVSRPCALRLSCAANPSWPKGTIERIAGDKYKVTGTYRIINETTVEITELPIRSWTQS